jgi:hypothetical protein
MLNPATEVLRISRLLKPERRADLLAWVRLAHFAENTARKTAGGGPSPNGVFTVKSQVLACENILNRSEK